MHVNLIISIGLHMSTNAAKLVKIGLAYAEIFGGI